MATTIQRVAKDTCQPLFRDPWGTCQPRQPRSQDRHGQAVMGKRLGCGTPVSGYPTSLCPHGLEENRVALSGKRSCCLSCCKGYLAQWVSPRGRTRDEGVSYRPVVLPMPDALPSEFARQRARWAAWIKCGGAMVPDALSWFKNVERAAGYVGVRETAGRAGHGHPPLHLVMPSGGMTPQHKWREVDDFSCTGLPKPWPYHLCTMLKHRGGTRALTDQLDALWRKSTQGLVAYVEAGTVPGGGEGVASYLAPYVGRPPISLRRLLGDDGQRGRSWENDQKTKKRPEAAVPVLTFMGRRGQHLLPKGFHRIRYAGVPGASGVE